MHSITLGWPFLAGRHYGYPCNHGNQGHVSLHEPVVFQAYIGLWYWGVLVILNHYFNWNSHPWITVVIFFWRVSPIIPVLKILYYEVEFECDFHRIYDMYVSDVNFDSERMLPRVVMYIDFRPSFQSTNSYFWAWNMLVVLGFLKSFV